MNFNELNEYIDNIGKVGVPFCDFAVALDGKEIYRRSSGYSDEALRHPTSPDDVYWIFSVSKVTTCTAAMQLVEKGLISLDTPLYEIMPEFKNMTVKADGGTVPAKNPIRICDLFTMTAGFNYDLNPLYAYHEAHPTEGTVEIIRTLASLPLEFEPSTRYRYSLCHDVLAAVVEIVSGVKFSDYVRKNIFEPLGMNTTGYHPAEDIQKRLTASYKMKQGYYISELIPRRNNYTICDNYDSGGAGLYSTVNDQLKLAAALSLGGISADGHRILSDKSVAMMGENRLTGQAVSDFGVTRLFGYGWGLCGRAHVNPTASRGLSSIGEFGWDGAAGAYILADPKKHLALYFATEISCGQYIYHMIHPTLRDMAYRAVFG